MSKSPDAFRTISEVAEWLDIQAHVLRFWESKFTQVKPVKRAGGRRYYRPTDMLLLGGIQHLLHEEGLSIKDAQAYVREHGLQHVQGLSKPLDGEEEEAIEAPVESKPTSKWVEEKPAEPEEAAPRRPVVDRDPIEEAPAPQPRRAVPPTPPPFAAPPRPAPQPAAATQAPASPAAAASGAAPVATDHSEPLAAPVAPEGLAQTPIEHTPAATFDAPRHDTLHDAPVAQDHGTAPHPVEHSVPPQSSPAPVETSPSPALMSTETPVEPQTFASQGPTNAHDAAAFSPEGEAESPMPPSETAETAVPDVAPMAPDMHATVPEVEAPSAVDQNFDTPDFDATSEAAPAAAPAAANPGQIAMPFDLPSASAPSRETPHSASARSGGVAAPATDGSTSQNDFFAAPPAADMTPPPEQNAGADLPPLAPDAEVASEAEDVFPAPPIDTEAELSSDMSLDMQSGSDSPAFEAAEPDPAEHDTAEEDPFAASSEPVDFVEDDGGLPLDTELSGETAFPSDPDQPSDLMESPSDLPEADTASDVGDMPFDAEDLSADPALEDTTPEEQIAEIDSDEDPVPLDVTEEEEAAPVALDAEESAPVEDIPQEAPASDDLPLDADLEMANDAPALDGTIEDEAAQDSLEAEETASDEADPSIAAAPEAADVLPTAETPIEDTPEEEPSLVHPGVLSRLAALEALPAEARAPLYAIAQDLRATLSHRDPL